MKIVLVEWIDSRFVASGWHSIVDVKDLDLARPASVGVLVSSDEEKIVLCGDMDYDTCSRSITIPKASIKRMRQLQL